MKRKNRKSKGILMVALILCISIGYAVLTSTLNITGNSEIKNAKWDIHFDNLVVDSSSVDATTPAAIDESKLTINYGVHLAKPGNVYSFTVDVVNEGTIDGMISTVTNTGLTEEQQKYVEYAITYDNGVVLQAKDGLKAGATKKVKVVVKYKDDLNPEDLPSEENTIDLTFKVTYVQADDTAKFPAAPSMKSYTEGSTDDYHNSTYQSKVTKIVTKTNIDVPATAIEQWDVSSTGDGRVIAYVEDDLSGNGTYQVTIGADGSKIIANEDSSVLFAGFSSLITLDLKNIDTSNVTNMVGMFADCSSLTSLDLSNFDTSNVTDMSSMFGWCTSLISLDLSNFDTSKVTSMHDMFDSCRSLTSLNLSSFDISNVTNMRYMFFICPNLTTNITIKNSLISSYDSMFGNAATADGAQITVNYTSATSDLVDDMIATKSDNSNVVKGSLVS